MWVAGVDGCPMGWLAVFRSLDGKPPYAQLFANFDDVIAAGPSVIAVDIPIGLPATSQRGGRTADREARSVLGSQRQSSVFPAPSRATLSAATFQEGCEIELRNSRPPKKISQQVFNIFRKIREIDDLARRHRNLIYECHPEVSFCMMNGNVPMRLPKKVSMRKNPSGVSGAGLRERCDLLSQNGFTLEFLTTRIGAAKEHGRDDLIDACAAAWTAERILARNAIRLPANADLDDTGLDMAIWA
jgi:predicted RNase H-like nuclease